MASAFSRYNLLVIGYLRREELQHNYYAHLPNGIKLIIFKFFPKGCKVYGIGENAYDELGTESALSQFQPLGKFNSHTFQPENMYRGYYRYVIKDNKNTIYSIGNNYNGDCGLGHTNKCKQLTKMIKIPTDDSSHVIIGSGSNTFICAIDNVLYGTGISIGVCFAGNRNTITPVRIEKKSPSNFGVVKQIEVSGQHVLILNEEGLIFAWGENAYFQCGVQSKLSCLDEITHVPCEVAIKSICVGNHFNLCVSSKDKLYVFGKNEMHECGIYGSSKVIIEKPTLHPYFREKNIMFMSSKRRHSLCIDDEGRVYLFGSNEKYQIWNQLKVSEIIDFKKRYADDKVYGHIGKELFESGCCGNYHTVLLTKSNKLISFGYNKHNQCSSVDKEMYIKYPHVVSNKEIGIDDEQRILRVVCGDDSTLILTQ